MRLPEVRPLKLTGFSPLLGVSLAFATAGGVQACAMGSDDTSTSGSGGSGGTGGTRGSGGSIGFGGTGGSAGAAGASGAGGAGGSNEVGPCENTAAVLAEHGITEASPIVSKQKNLVASAGVENAEALVDGEYRTSQPALFGNLEAGPEWVAIDVGVGPSRLALLWTDTGSSEYTSLSGGAPQGYRIETSPDSSDGEDGEWVPALEVTDNTVRNRAHSFGFDAMRWVRFTATASSEGRTVKLIELELHDISTATGDRPQDGWLFFGDSIHQAAMNRTSSAESFASLVTAQHPAFETVMLNASIGGEHLSDAIARLDELLALNPDIEHVAIAYGTNDSWSNKDPEEIGFRDELVEVVETILDAGHTPVIAHIPYALVAHDTLPEFNSVIDDVALEYGLPCGPDLYSHFLEHPEELGSDGVHPNSRGNASIQRLWASAAAPLYLDQ